MKEPDLKNPLNWAGIGIITGAILTWNFWVGLAVAASVFWVGLRAMRADARARALRDKVYWITGAEEAQDLIARLPSHAEVIRHTQVRNTFDEGVSFAYENVYSMVSKAQTSVR